MNLKKNWRHPPFPPENLETPPTPEKFRHPRKFGDPPGPDPPRAQTTPAPPCGQTDACELITLAQLRCGW